MNDANRLSPYRWIIEVLLLLTLLSQSVTWLAPAPILLPISKKMCIRDSYGAVFLDVQISLGQLEAVLIPSAQDIGLAIRLVEVVLVARIDQAVDADAEVRREVLLGLHEVVLDHRYVCLLYTSRCV